MDQLRLIHIWRVLNQNQNTWSSSSRTQRSRIDFWLVSSNWTRSVKDGAHGSAPPSHHLSFRDIWLKGGDWKFNINLLMISAIWLKNKQIFILHKDQNEVQKWGFFKYEIRRSKETQKDQMAKEVNIMTELNELLLKPNLNEEEGIKINDLKEEIDEMFTVMTKAAFIRS